MSTPNFRTQDNFPLYIFDDSELDEWEAQDVADMLADDMETINRDFQFFRLVWRSGYYCGVQFYVEMMPEADNAGFTPDGDLYSDNGSCNYYLGCCHSVAVRRFEREARKMQKKMAKLAEAWDFEKYYCAGIFSNGDAIYKKAG